MNATSTQYKVHQLGDPEGFFEAVNFQIYRENHGWVLIAGLLNRDGFTKPESINLSCVQYNTYHASGSQFETEAAAQTIADQLEAL